MNILVTGSDGYIGANLVQMLIKKGYNVIGLDTGFYRSGWFHNGIISLPFTYSKDVRQITENELNGIDIVVHLAELSNDPLSENNPEATYKINHLGTMLLAKKAKAAGVSRFIYYSSCSVYGTNDSIADENSKLNPLTEYARCKVLNEKELLKLADDNFSPVILRNATAYGVSSRMRFDLVVNNLTGWAWTKKEVKLESDGSPWRPLVHVSDICRATIAAINARKYLIHKEIYNVGAINSNYQIKEIAEKIEKACDGAKIKFGKTGADKRNYRVNFKKINSKLTGFESVVNLDKGIKELFEAYKLINLNSELFKSKAFTRTKQINYLHQTQQIDDDFFWT